MVSLGFRYTMLRKDVSSWLDGTNGRHPFDGGPLRAVLGSAGEQAGAVHDAVCQRGTEGDLLPGGVRLSARTSNAHLAAESIYIRSPPLVRIMEVYGRRNENKPL